MTRLPDKPGNEKPRRVAARRGNTRTELVLMTEHTKKRTASATPSRGGEPRA